MKTIIRLTFLEMLRKKVLYLTLIISIVFLGLYGTVLHYAYLDGYLRSSTIARITIVNQFLTLGIYVVGFITAFLSVFASVGAISDEIERGTLDSILAKPLHRYEILLGKLSGILMLILPYTGIMFLSVIGMNEYFGSGVMIGLSLMQVVKSILLLFMLPVMLVAVSILFSTFFSTMGAGVTLVMLYFCAMIGGIMEQVSGFMQNGSSKTIISNIGIITSLIMPSDAIYRKASSILFTTASGMNLNTLGMIGAGSEPSAFMMVYAGVYIVCVVMLAIKHFNRA